MRKRTTVIASLMLALGVAPAAAHWRDYLGKTMIVEVRTTSRSISDVLDARGGAGTANNDSTSTCDTIYHIYVSQRGRLFMHSTSMTCGEGNPFVPDEPSGLIFDLNQAEGIMDAGQRTPPLPFRTRLEGADLVIEQPQTDYVFNGDGYVSTISNSSGGFVNRFRFADECSLSISGHSTYRFEYRSTTSDYYVLQDSDASYTASTNSCRIVDGFVPK